MAGAVVQPGQFSEQSTAAVAPRRKTRWSAGSVILLVALFILVPLVGVGATLGILYANGEFPAKQITTKNTPAQSPQSTASSGQGTPTTGSLQPLDSTSSSELGISMQFPIDWNEDTSHMATTSPAVVFRPQGQNGIAVVVQRFASAINSSVTSASDLNQQLMQANFQDPSSNQHIHNYKTVVPQSPQRTIGGDQWVEQDGTYTDDFGVLMHAASIAVQHNQVYYNIFFIVPDASYNDIVPQSIQPMLDSLKFLS